MRRFLKILLSILFLLIQSTSGGKNNKYFIYRKAIGAPKSINLIAIKGPDYSDIRYDVDHDGKIDQWFISKGRLSISNTFEKGTLASVEITRRYDGFYAHTIFKKIGNIFYRSSNYLELKKTYFQSDNSSKKFCNLKKSKIVDEDLLRNINEKISEYAEGSIWENQIDSSCDHLDKKKAVALKKTIKALYSVDPRECDLKNEFLECVAKKDTKGLILPKLLEYLITTPARTPQSTNREETGKVSFGTQGLEANVDEGKTLVCKIHETPESCSNSKSSFSSPRTFISICSNDTDADFIYKLRRDLIHEAFHATTEGSQKCTSEDDVVALTNMCIDGEKSNAQRKTAEAPKCLNDMAVICEEGSPGCISNKAPPLPAAQDRGTKPLMEQLPTALKIPAEDSGGMEGGGGSAGGGGFIGSPRPGSTQGSGTMPLPVGVPDDSPTTSPSGGGFAGGVSGAPTWQEASIRCAACTAFNARAADAVMPTKFTVAEAEKTFLPNTTPSRSPAEALNAGFSEIPMNGKARGNTVEVIDTNAELAAATPRSSETAKAGASGLSKSVTALSSLAMTSGPLAYAAKLFPEDPAYGAADFKKQAQAKAALKASNKSASREISSVSPVGPIVKDTDNMDVKRKEVAQFLVNSDISVVKDYITANPKVLEKLNILILTAKNEKVGIQDPARAKLKFIVKGSRIYPEDH